MLYKPSYILRALQRQPVLLHLCGMIMVPVLIIFLPIVLYAVLFQAAVSFVVAMKHVPWGPVILVIVISAMVCLLNMPWGIRIQESDSASTVQDTIKSQSEMIEPVELDEAVTAMPAEAENDVSQTGSSAGAPKPAG